MAFSFISSPSFSWRKAPAWITLFWRLLEKDHIINGNRPTSWTSIIWKVLLDLQWSRIVSLLWSYITLRLWDSYLDIQKHQMTWLTKRLCDIADDQKDKCEKISNRGHERSTVQVELEKSFATGERRAIWRSTLTYDTFKNEATLKNEACLHDEDFLVGACMGVNFWRFSIKLGWSSLFSCFITFSTCSFVQSSYVVLSSPFHLLEFLHLLLR